MKIERPQFELTRVYEDGTQDTPEIIPVGQMPWDTKMARRGFLGVGVGVASLLLLLDGNAEGFAGEQSSTPQQAHAPMKVPSEALYAHDDTVTALMLTADGKTLISGSDDETFKLWAMPSGKLRLRRKLREATVLALAMAPKGRSLFTGCGDNTIKQWGLSGALLQASLRGHKEEVLALAVSADSKLLISASADHTIKLWSLPDRKLLATLTGHQASVAALALSPDGATLASGSDDKTIKLWSLTERKLLASLEGHTGSVNALAITPDGRLLASGSSDDSVRLWSLPEGKVIRILKEHSNSVNALAMAHDGKTLFSGSADNSIKLWSVEDGKLLGTLEGHHLAVQSLAATPDGELLFSGHSDAVIIVWDLLSRSFRSFLFDRAANDAETKGVSYNVYDKVSGRVVTYTLPCGSPIPRGAVCTCNCVRGTYREPYEPSSGGTICTCNKICTCIPVPSDRNVKEAFETTDPLVILQRLAELPIQTWNYNWDDASIRHIGPMAQDFAAAFAVGEDDKHIHPVDAQGIAFAAIQGLYRMAKEKESLLEQQRQLTESLQQQLQRQQQESDELKERLESLERLILSRSQ